MVLTVKIRCKNVSNIEDGQLIAGRLFLQPQIGIIGPVRSFTDRKIYLSNVFSGLTDRPNVSMENYGRLYRCSYPCAGHASDAL